MKGSVLLSLLVIELSCGSLHTLYDQLCLGIHNGFLRHPVDCHKFIRCSRQRAYEFHCPANLLWHQEIKSCDYSYRTECKVNAIGVKGQKINVTEMLVGLHNKLTTSDKEIEVKVDSVSVKKLVTATTQKPTRKLHNTVQVFADKFQKPFTTVKDHVNTIDHKEHSVKLTQADNKNIAAKEYFVKTVTPTDSLQSANPEQENLVVATENAINTLNFLKVLDNKVVAIEVDNVNDLAVSYKENKSRVKRKDCNSVSKLKEKATANKNNKRNIKKITVNNVNLTDNSTVKPNINFNDSIESFDTNSANGLNLTEENAVKITDNINNDNITVTLNNDFNSMENSSEKYNAAMITEQTVHYNNVNVTEAILTEFPKIDSGITKNLNNSFNLKENKQYETEAVTTSSSENNNRIIPTDKTVALNADNVTEAILREFPKSDTGFTKYLNNSLNLKENKQYETEAVTKSSPENNNRTMLTEKTVSANTVSVTEPILTDFRNASNEITRNLNKSLNSIKNKGNESSENNNRTMLIEKAVAVNAANVTEPTLIDVPKAATEITYNLENSLNLKESTLENQHETEASSTDNKNRTLITEESIYVNVTEAILTDFPKLHNSLNFKENKTVAVTAGSAENNYITMITKETFSVNANTVTEAILTNFPKPANKVTKNFDNSSNLNENISAELIYKDNDVVALKQSSNTVNSTHNSSMLEEQTNSANLLNSTESLLTVSRDVATETFENFSISLQPTEIVADTVTDVETRQTTASILNSLNTTEGFTGNHNSSMLKQENSFANFINSSETDSSENVFNTAVNVPANSTNTENENVAVAKNSTKNISETGLKKDNNSTNDIDLTQSLLKAFTETMLTENFTVKETEDDNENLTVVAENSIESNYLNKIALKESILEEFPTNLTVSKPTQAENVSLTMNAENPVNYFNLSFNQSNNSDSLTDLNLTADFPVKKMEEENVNLTVNAENHINTVNFTESFNQTNKATDNVLTENPVKSVNLTENVVEYITEATAKDFSVKLTYNVNKTTTETTDYSINDKNYKETMLIEATVKTANDENKNVRDFYDKTTPVINGNTNKGENVTLTMLTAEDEILKEITPTNETFIQNAENSVNIGNVTEIMSKQDAVNNEHVKETMFTDDPVKNVDDEIQNFNDFYIGTTSILKENSATTESLMENAENYVKSENVKETIFTENPVKTADDENKNFKDFSIETTPLLKQYTAPTNTHFTAETSIETPLQNVNNTMLKANLTESMEINNSLESKNLTNLSPALTTTQILLNKNVQSESTTPALPTTLAVLFAIDNTTVDPRLPFRSLECQGPNNRRQFKAPKCYQYYQCFAGWAFLLNCHEGWRFEVTEGQCILDVNKECEL